MASLPQQSATKIHSQHPTPLRRLQPPRFRRGDRVEVASEQEGFVGSYFEATVVADRMKDGYVVQYRTLVNDDFSAPLQELVTAAEVRPTPPPIYAAAYRVGDVVDAFDNDGWWWGRITGRIGDDYSVFFETTGDLVSYSIDRLRVHQDWINGKWIFPSNQVIVGQAAVQRCNATVTFETENNIFFPPTLNNDGLHTLFHRVAGDMLGAAAVKHMQPLMGSEDFSFYQQLIPAYYFFVGMQDEGGLPFGAALHASLVIRYLSHGSTAAPAIDRRLHDEL